MSWTKFIGIYAVTVAMIYSALAIGIPEIRLNWRGTETRLGLLSSIGHAMFFWGPMTVYAAVNRGILSSGWMFTGYLLCLGGLIVAFVGYLLDVNSKT